MVTLSGIYKIENTLTTDCYIGSSVDVKRRFRTHKYHLNKGIHHSPYLQRSWDKYGKQCFTWEILEECSNEDLLSREQYYFNLLKPTLNSVKQAGSPKGYKHTEEAKIKIGTANKGKVISESHRNSISVSNTGRVYSENTLEKMRESHKNISQETKDRISRSKKGIKLTQETKDKIGKALKGRKASQEAIVNMKAAQKGYKPSLKTIEASAEKRKGIPLSEEVKAKISKANSGRKRDPDAVARSWATRKTNKES